MKKFSCPFKSVVLCPWDARGMPVGYIWVRRVRCTIHTRWSSGCTQYTHVGRVCMVRAQYTHVRLVCFVHTHYTHVRLVCFVHAQYTQIRPVCVVHTHYTHVRLVCIIHTHYTQARRVCIVYTHYAQVRLVCIVHLTRHPHLQCVTRPRCAIVCCSVECVAELVYTYRHKPVRYGFHLLLWVLCKRATFLWGSFANKPYKRAWLCCGFCAT